MKSWCIGVLLGGIVLGACDDELTDFVSPLPTAISSSSSYTTAGITFLISNPADGDVIFLDRCLAEVQEFKRGTWKLSVARFCNQDPDDDRLTVKLLPGEQLTDTSFFRAVLEPGEYRAVFYVSEDTAAVLRQRVFSNTFSVFPTGS